MQMQTQRHHAACQETYPHRATARSPEAMLLSKQQRAAAWAGSLSQLPLLPPHCCCLQGIPTTLNARMAPVGGPLVSSGRKVLPTLGLAWSHCVNTRLFVARHDGIAGGTLRTLQVSAVC